MDDQKVLEYCLQKWNKDFCGISSLEVADNLHLNHEEIRDALRRLKDDHKGTLIDGVQLSFGLELNERSEPKNSQLITLFYPAHGELKQYYETHTVEFNAFPPFKEALHLGHRTNELYFFYPSVLKRYSGSSQKYNLQDFEAVGFFSSNKDYISTLELPEAEKKSFSLKHYGKIQTEEGDCIVTSNLADLAELPAPEQEHWFSHQTKSTVTFLDLEFQKNYLQFFKGVTGDSHDPLYDLFALLQKINTIQHLGKIFSNLDSSDLSYPVENTYKNFCSCCKKLYKQIGPSKLDGDILQKFLTNNFHYKDTDFNFEQYKKNHVLFQQFLDKFSLFGKTIQTLTTKVKHHQILDPKQQEKDFLMEFKKICLALLTSYRILYEELKPPTKVQHPNQVLEKA